MAKYIFTAQVEIDADSAEDARIELLCNMDEYEIYWECDEDFDETREDT